MSRALPVVVLHGAVAEDAPADEQDVLIEVDAVCASLQRLGRVVEVLPLTLNLQAAREHLSGNRPALVFNLVESIDGRGHFAPVAATLLEDLGLPYTGAPLAALFMSSNKLLAKRALERAGINTPAWCSTEGPPHSERAPRWIVKSVWEHASIGIDDESVVDASRLTCTLAARRQRFGGEWFGERYIEGREFNIAVIDGPDEPQILPAAEIRFVDFPGDKPRIVGYAAKWATNSFEYGHTPRGFDFDAADQPLLKELAEIAKRCWSLFECRGYARIDFRVDGEGRPWVLEVNANPCLAPDAGFAAAARQGGLSYDGMIERIIEASDTKRASRTTIWN